MYDRCPSLATIETDSLQIALALLNYLHFRQEVPVESPMVPRLMKRMYMTGRSTRRGSLCPSLTETQRILTTGDWYGLLPPTVGEKC